MINDPVKSIRIVERFVDTLIEHKKILIALVNGPAIGIACTILALFDAVIASDKAYFWCPFSELGLLPEGTSTHSFLQLMGLSKASKILLFGERVSAKEAFDLGLVSYLLSDKEFLVKSEELLSRFSKLNLMSLLLSKNMLRSELVHLQKTANQREIKAILEHWSRGSPLLAEKMTMKKVVSKSNI